VVEFKDESHTFKRVYFHADTAVLVPVNPAYEPELKRRTRIRRMMRVWGVKF
jgi:SOS-response transcriptional repressor LexA